MAHHQSKSVRSHRAEQQKGFNISNTVHSNGIHNQEELSKVTSEQEATATLSQSRDADEGGGWQIKFVLGVIVAGVLMLILKTIGLF